MTSGLQLGSRVGRFQLLWELGRGGMASVWIAHERSQRTGKQRLVAVKAMLPKLAKRPDFRSMFLDEGQLVRSIEHPNVVPVYEVGEDQGILYMAMEWVEGDSLYTLIKGAKQRRAIPPEQAVRIIADTAAGLHVAHELRGWDGELRGVVHCDVSPQNILVGLNGQSKLVDFGVAHAVATSEEASSDRIAGKAGYMSPEQALGETLDRRSDLFALGIVLFELTTGERLFRGRDRAHTLHLVHFAEIPKPSTIYPDYPKTLEAIVLRGLERDRERRFQTAEEFAQALEHYLVEERIMVARASTGQLLKRVLGGRIQKRRDSIREALKVMRAGTEGARLAATSSLLPSGEISMPSTTGLSSPSLVSRSSASWVAGTGEIAPSSYPPPPSQIPATATPGPAIAEARRSSSSSLLMVAIPMLLLVGGVGAYYWTQMRPSSTQPASNPETAKARAAAEAASDDSKEASESSSAAGDAGSSAKAGAPKRAWPRAPAYASPAAREQPADEADDPYAEAEVASAETEEAKPEAEGEKTAAAEGTKKPAAGGSPPPAATTPEIEPLPGSEPATGLPTPPKKKKKKIDFSNPYK